MATEAQNTANLANAQLSTGPTTDAGKAISSHNALKHGLNALTVLLPGEDQAAYSQLCTETFDFWKPANTPEKDLVQILCDTQWRIARCARLEASALSGDVPDFKAYDVINRNDARLRRNYAATLKELRELVNTRIAQREAQLRDARMLRRAHKLRGQDNNLESYGFDFSLAEVDASLYRVDSLNWAQGILHSSNGYGGKHFSPKI